MRINIRCLKLNIYSLLLGFLYAMPVIDSISGALHESYPVGQFYRIIFFVYLLFILMKISAKIFSSIMCFFLFFVLFQVIVSTPGGYVVKSVQDTIKLFIPIIMISLFQILLKNGKIKAESLFRLLNYWSLIYPILIIGPGILGMGVPAYDGAIGWKGFFFAVNEISFIMSSLVIYRFYLLSETLTIRSLLMLCLNIFCIIMIGTKTGYASVGVGMVVLGMLFFRERKFRRLLKIFIVTFVIIIAALIFRERIVEMTAGFFDRWFYQRQLSYSTTDFLFSMRLRRFDEAFTLFCDGLYFVFGWGFGGELVGMPNMEMDFLDILFKSGIIGIVYVMYYYLKVFLRIDRKNVWGKVIFLWSMALAFGAGHVLYYGQSGMMLALNCIYIKYISKKEV